MILSPTMLKYTSKEGIVWLAAVVLVLSGCNLTAQVTQDNISFDNEAIPILSQEDKHYFITVAQTSVSDFFSGKVEAEHTWPARYDGVNNTVFIAFRLQGKKKGSWSARENNLASSIYIATQRTLKDQRYNGSIEEKDIPNLKIEMFILGKNHPYNSTYEPGIHGIKFKKGNKVAVYYNDVAIELNHNTAKLLESLCKKAKLPEDCAGDPNVEKYIFRTLHFGTTHLSPEIVTFYRGNTPALEVNSTKDRIQKSLDLAFVWFKRHIKKNGTFEYIYNPSNEKYSDKNTIPRQLMASVVLAKLSQDNPNYLDTHRKNLNYIFDNWYREDGDKGYIYNNKWSSLGSNSMAIRALSYSPLFDEYKDKADKLANTIMSMQHEDGSFDAFYAYTGTVNNENWHLAYSSGGAILGMSELYERTKEQSYLETAHKAQDFYLVEYVDKIDENYYPGYVPWHTMSLSTLFKITGDEKYIAPIFTINDKLIEMQNTDGRPYMDYLGSFFNPKIKGYQIPYSTTNAVIVEGLAYAYEIARDAGDVARTEKYRNSVLLGAHNLMNLQFAGPNMYYMQKPERAEGGFHYNAYDNRIRIDAIQHTIDAFTKIIALELTE